MSHTRAPNNGHKKHISHIATSGMEWHYPVLILAEWALKKRIWETFFIIMRGHCMKTLIRRTMLLL